MDDEDTGPRMRPPPEPEVPQNAEPRQQRSSGNGGGAVPLIEIGAKLELFHDSGGNAYAVRPLPSGGTRTMSLASGAYRSWLAGEYHRHAGGKKAASTDALATAIGVLTARALERKSEEAHVRVAQHEHTIYLDLADDTGLAVEISASGWRMTKTAPVRFRCERGMLPLPIPEHGGSLEELRALINAPGDAEWRLLLGWLVATLRPDRPFPVLALQGEQGSAKSTTARFLRGLVDPARPPDRARPRDERDLAIAARNSWVLAYDNLSGLHEWLSDALCRLATGGGFATRKLYADDDEAIFDFCRPVMLNGIDELLMRPDLADRALRITLPAISDNRRRPAAAVLAEYEASRPRILGALCDAVSGAIRGLPAAERRIKSLPRMADFAHWASAAEEGLGWPEGAFLEAYTRNRSELVSESLEDDPVASAVSALLADGSEWTGTAAQLLKRLAEIAGFEDRPPRDWPSGPRALSGRLRRAAPLLRRIGIEWKPPRVRSGRNRDRIHTLSCSGPSAPPASAASARNRADVGQDNADPSSSKAGGRERASGAWSQPSAPSPSQADGATGADGYVHAAATWGTSRRADSLGDFGPESEEGA